MAFNELKKRITTVSVLRHFDLKATTYIKTDASDYVSGGVLLQKDKEENLHSVAYFSKLMTPAECNYDIYDKELLAIIHCLEQWRLKLKSCEESIKIIINYKNLKYFYITKKLS